ncbi:MAG: hypothetical protein L6R36_007854 [Xanthoria steineri]|nr:MAG: hypothetical protein L6R36_007854 [Xanthoria steineri]
MILRSLLFLFWAAAPCHCEPQPTQQKPLQSVVASSNGGERQLHGRFLHITDFHPDRFYSRYSSTDSDDACHWGKGDAGIFGAERTDCDSPITLINATFQWINDNLKDTIDFVVWTGDSARHDNDELIPRTPEQVIELNEMLVQKFVELFGKPDNINDTDPTNDFTIPIVPNFGNNDILPHNIFTPGPNRWTKEFSHVWRQFIPEEQRHGFERGGWFFVEVIPNQLAVLSLNTLYFFNSNNAVDGCAAKSEPGYEQFEWLRIQLQFFRQRGMKAILMGHVPPARTPSKQSWDETCWQKYTLWLQQYRDVIVGGLYGHMNIDHFMIQDNDQVDIQLVTGEIEPAKKPPKSTDFSIQSSAAYLTELRYGWSNLPDGVEAKDVGTGTEKKKNSNKKKKKGRKSKHDEFLDKIGGQWAERYSATLVSASVVPNYFPTMRVFEYNITGAGQPLNNLQDQVEEVADAQLDALKRGQTFARSRKHGFVKPHPPSKSQPPGPAYSPQTFSWASYTQYFANLTRINADFASPRKSKDAKFTYEVEYDTKNDSVFGLEDLTVRNYVDLATRIGDYKPRKDDRWSTTANDVENDMSAAKKRKHKKSKKHKKHKKQKRINKIWFAFVNRAYVGAKDEEDLHDQFGFAMEND